ncbi:MAG: RNA polymerase sigma factor [Lachnospiraceae bacterium]|nr:RNA polymerase sigma factor [Lachnospiraceae bacterium]
MEQFEDIYKKYYEKVYLFLLRCTANPSLTEELTQETLYKAFLHIHQYEGRSSIYTWLCKIAKNTWITERGRQKRMVQLQEDWEAESGENLEETILKRQLLELMRRELWHLPEPYLSVCTLRIYAELPYAEIASEYGKSESWAKVTFYRGKVMLMERMEKYQ